MTTNPTDMGLPSMAYIQDLVPDIPEFDRKFQKRQGPKSTEKDPKGRTFSASGPSADIVVRIILADQGLTRKQIAIMAGCSASRVSEVLWTMEAAHRKGQLEKRPTIPRSAVTEEDDDGTD